MRNLPALERFDQLAVALGGGGELSVSIVGADSLTGLGGLRRARTLSELRLVDNEALTQITPALRLERVEVFEIKGNGALRSLEGFSKLERVSEEVEIRDNPKLARCAAIEFVTSLERRPRRVDVENNDVSDRPMCEEPDW
jgi:hypothetical protein